jgi:CBS domain-containing membrane protein
MAYASAGIVKLPALAAHHNRRLVYAVFVFLATAASIGSITAVAYWTRDPLVVPSLGPTAFLVFNRAQSNAAWPRNIFFGHLTGALAGYISLLAFGLAHAPSVMAGGVTAPRVGAAALSIALTSAVMVLFHIEHGPAGATTLIVSLGFMTTPSALGLLMGGVVFLVLLGLGIDRAVGLKPPWWSGWPHSNLGSRLAAFSSPQVSAGNGHFLSEEPGPGGHPATEGPVGAGAREGGSPAWPGWRSVRRGSPAIGGPVRPTPAPARPAWVVEPHCGRQAFIGPGRCVVKVQDAHSSGAYSLLEVYFEPVEPSTFLHSHFDFSETYFVLEGEVAAEVGTERHTVTPGSTITVPAGMPHAVAAARGRPARCLCITDRAVHSDFEYLP